MFLHCLSNKDWFSVQIVNVGSSRHFVTLSGKNSLLRTSISDIHYECDALHLQRKIQFTTIRSVATRGAIKPLKTGRFWDAETCSERSPLIEHTRKDHPSVATSPNTLWKLANSKHSWKDSVILKHVNVTLRMPHERYHRARATPCLVRFKTEVSHYSE
jgi:hypothetical protein